MLVDSHCHLNFPDFKEDLDAVIAHAEVEGVTHMQTICTKIREFPEIRGIAERYPNVWCSVGIHPHEAGNESVTYDELKGYAGHEKVIGIGETGLDYFYEHSPRKAQQESFRTHIAVSRDKGLPLIVHTRDADEDTLDILSDEMQKGVFPGLIHCFSSSLELAEICVDMGMYISISGIVTFKKAEALREAVEALPLERLLVETDAPYLAPMPYRGKRNEPAYTRFTAEKVAEIKNVSLEEVARVTTGNFFRLFSKAVV